MTRPEKRVPVAAIVGSILGFMAILLLCAGAFLIHRRRRTSRHTSPRTLPLAPGRYTEDLLDAEAQIEALRMSEKEQMALSLSQGAAPLSVPTAPESPSLLPKAAETTIANVVEEMRMMRIQIQRLELERPQMGYSEEDRPPEYATK